jgi:class 3 adenylate cyclase
MNRYFKESRATVERHGGTVDRFVGDAVMALFGIPRVCSALIESLGQSS